MTASTKSKEIVVSYERIGNTATALSFVSAIVYAVAVVNDWNGFDTVWKDTGFCVSNPDEDYWTSHDLCLYVDVLQCALMVILYFSLGKTNKNMGVANEFLVANGLAHFIHGIAHGYIAKLTREGTMPDPNESLMDEWRKAETNLQVVKDVAVLMAFWLIFTRALMSYASWTTIVVVASLIAYVGANVIEKFSFTYTQTVIFVVSSAGLLIQPPSTKGFEYAVVSSVVGFPSTLVAWMEAMLCTGGVMDVGGHLMYDGFLGVAVLVVYMLCWWNHKGSETKKKTV